LLDARIATSAVALVTEIDDLQVDRQMRATSGFANFAGASFLGDAT
jgi:hypothetical protein